LHWHRRRRQAWLPTTTAGTHACSSLERGPVGIAERAPIERDVHLLEEPLAVGRHHLALEPDAGVVHVAPAVGAATRPGAVHGDVIGMDSDEIAIADVACLEPEHAALANVDAA